MHESVESDAISGLAPTLHAAGFLWRIDRDMFALYCSIWSQWRRLNETLNAEGFSREGYKGTHWQRPEVAAAMKLTELLMKLMTAFGMTPASRARLKPNPPTAPEDDALAPPPPSIKPASWNFPHRAG